MRLICGLCHDLRFGDLASDLFVQTIRDHLALPCEWLRELWARLRAHGSIQLSKGACRGPSKVDARLYADRIRYVLTSYHFPHGLG